MMNDKDLVQVAREAYFSPHYLDFLGDADMRKHMKRWNPLENHTQAFELMLKFDIAVRTFHSEKTVVAYGHKTDNTPEGCDVMEYYTHDPADAAMRAITKAVVLMQE